MSWQTLPSQIFRSIVADNCIIKDNRIINADYRGLLIDPQSQKTVGFIPQFDSDVYILPKIQTSDNSLPSFEERLKFIEERSKWRGPNVSLLDANFFERLFVSSNFCRETFGHAIPFPYITGASGAGKQDMCREALFLHFGLSMSSDDETSAGRSFPRALQRLAKNKMPLVFGEANKGGDKSFSLSANPDFHQFVLSAYDGVCNSNLHTKRPMNGFLIFNGATIPTDGDELSKRLEEVEIKRRPEHSPDAIASLKKMTKSMRGVIIELQKSILGDPAKARENFVAEYNKAQEEITSWSHINGRDSRHLGHAALAIAASRLVNYAFPIATQVEDALKRRFLHSENVSRFQKTSTFLTGAYQAFTVRSNDLSGAIHLINLQKAGVNQRFLCMALRTTINQIQAVIGNKWQNSCRESHIYANLGVGEGPIIYPWVIRIPRDRNRKEGCPLRNKEILVFALDHPDFPEELQASTEDIAGLYQNAERKPEQMNKLPWGKFEELVEGGKDVG